MSAPSPGQDAAQTNPDPGPGAAANPGVPGLLKLSDLSVGQKARVASFDLAPDQRGRLLEMGVTVGVPVEVVRFAPLGDPIDFKVRGYHLSLRKREAAGIRVTLL